MFNVSGNTFVAGNQKIDHKPKTASMRVPGLLFQAGPYVGFQTAPQKRLIHIKPKGGEEGQEEKYTIQLPWIVYVVSVFDGIVSNITIFGSAHQVRSINSPLYRLPLPNIYPDGKFCMPVEAVKAPDDLESLFSSVLGVVWDSYFNADLFEEIKPYIWDFPFMFYPKDLPEEYLAQRVFVDMLTPGDVFKVWEERVTIKNLEDLFNEDMRLGIENLKLDMPFFSIKQIAKINCLHYMG